MGKILHVITILPLPRMELSSGALGGGGKRKGENVKDKVRNRTDNGKREGFVVKYLQSWGEKAYSKWVRED